MMQIKEGSLVYCLDLDDNEAVYEIVWLSNDKARVRAVKDPTIEFDALINTLELINDDLW